MTVKETAYTVKRRLVGKQPKPKVPRADHAADDEVDFDIDPEVGGAHKGVEGGGKAS